ncbi:MAG: methylated-DNA--[protein]-cysteine S-methyltransferase [Thermodesulfobacteriota bacterium]|nr:methylated-DNA--[protein]-cysteine S-methyltransferase [Thermodesulfobacteriota bacterium]
MKSFSLPLAPDGTDFQKKVWQAMLNIPWGTTVSYQNIAKAIRNPLACRAVGGAASANPIPLVIPCHRVIGKNGTLTGFGSGLKIKKYLIELETENL